MKALIDGGLDPNVANRDGQTLLYVAVKGNQLKMAEYLLSAGAGVDVPSSGTGRTPLFQAAFDGFHESLTDMFDDIVDKNAAAMVELLIARGADVNARNQFGWTPLHDAVAGKNLHVVKILLAHGAAADVSDQDGVTPLALAEQSGQVEIATILREHINN